MSSWTPDDRDDELEHIGHVTKAVLATAVGGTVVLGAGIAWGDQQRIDQADARESAQQTQPTDSIQPPANSPTAPTSQPASTPTSKSKPKSKSGGS